MRGVPRNRVVLEEHNPAWAEEFRRTKALLESIHGDRVIDIQHVGSTAIEGIAAKPMLDVAVLFSVMTDAVFAAMRDHGYEYYGEVANGKHLFILRNDRGDSLEHVHGYEVKNRGLFDEQIRFRDFLRAHPAYAGEYEQLKRALCQAYADDRRRYTAGKQAFFDRIRVLAEREQRDARPEPSGG